MKRRICVPRYYHEYPHLIPHTTLWTSRTLNSSNYGADVRRRRRFLPYATPPRLPLHLINGCAKSGLRHEVAVGPPTRNETSKILGIEESFKGKNRLPHHRVPFFSSCCKISVSRIEFSPRLFQKSPFKLRDPLPQFREKEISGRLQR